MLKGGGQAGEPINDAMEAPQKMPARMIRVPAAATAADSAAAAACWFSTARTPPLHTTSINWGGRGGAGGSQLASQPASRCLWLC